MKRKQFCQILGRFGQLVNLLLYHVHANVLHGFAASPIASKCIGLTMSSVVYNGK